MKPFDSLACHHTVYDAKMDLRDPAEHRQCPGATAIHRSGDLMHKVE